MGQEEGGGDESKRSDFTGGKIGNNNYKNNSLESVSLSEGIVSEAIGLW